MVQAVGTCEDSSLSFQPSFSSADGVRLCRWSQADRQVEMMEVVAAGLRRAGRGESAEREVIRKQAVSQISQAR